MMRLLHTSDWHLGHVLYEHERQEEQRNFLNQVVAVAEAEQPDAVVVCGDIFDKPSPPLWAREAYIDTLLRLRQVCPAATLVVTAGNHDSKMSIEVEGRLWARLGVHVVGQVTRDDEGFDLQRHIIAVAGADGKQAGWIVAVPHIYDLAYPQLNPSDDAAQRQRTFHKTLLDRVQAQNADALPVVVTAHLTFANCDMQGHDVRPTVGGVEQVGLETLGGDYDYLALGHIHRRQTLHATRPTVHYCGTPIPISFDEMCDHSLTLVALQRGAEPQLTFRPVENSRPLLTIPAQPVPFAAALAAAVAHADQPAYVRLHVLLDEPLPANYNEKIAAAFADTPLLYCCMKLERPLAQETTGDEPVQYTVDNLPSPIDMADRHYRNRFRNALPPRLSDKLLRAVALAEQTDQA